MGPDHPSWWPEFLLDHQQRHPKLPKPTVADAGGFYRGLLANLRANGVLDHDLLIRASTQLQATPHHFGEHVARLIGLAIKLRLPDNSIPVSVGSTYAAFDRAAADHWDALDDRTRDQWRERVRRRWPELAQRTAFVEEVAKGWHYEPGFFTDDVPAPVPGSALGPPAAEPPIITDAERIARRQAEHARQLEALMRQGGRTPGEPTF